MKRDTTKPHDLSTKNPSAKLARGQLDIALVMSSQADLNCDVKPGNSERTCSSAIVAPVVFVFTSCTS